MRLKITNFEHKKSRFSQKYLFWDSSRTLNFPILIKIPIFVGQGFDITDFPFESILFKRKIYLKASFCQNNPFKKLGCHRKWGNIEIAGSLTGDWYDRTNSSSLIEILIGVFPRLIRISFDSFEFGFGRISGFFYDEFQDFLPRVSARDRHNYITIPSDEIQSLRSGSYWTVQSGDTSSFNSFKFYF